jgi:hypothetical protein
LAFRSTQKLAIAIAMLLLATPAVALTIPLKSHRVNTSIEGTSVDLFITGPVTLDFGAGGVAIHVDAIVDLGDVQKKFAAIVLARAVTRTCGDSITLQNAALQPENMRDAVVAGIVANANIRHVSCGADGKPIGTPTVVSGVLGLRLKAKVTTNEWLAFDMTASPRTSAAVATLLDDRSLYEALASMVSGTLSAAAGTESVTAALNSEAASYDPRVKSASFEALPNGALSAHLVVTLDVPLLKVNDWKIGQ